MVNTGETVLNEKGVLPACTEMKGLCGYACCKFSNNWIMLLPGEYELAVQKNLKQEHLDFKSNSQVVCTTPCQTGDLKPIDCAWYPLFPANNDATQFLVADHRKCPIPNQDLIDKMLEIHASASAWEQRHPGSLAQMAALSRGFVGYMPFPYKIENNAVVNMDSQELQAIALPTELPKDYVCEEWTVPALGYGATYTPNDRKIAAFSF
jgi:hypothetical protein